MNRKQKQEFQKNLAEYFEVPHPERKRAFMRRFGLPSLSLTYVVWMQARYISKWVWAFSAFFCGLTILVAAQADARFVNAVYACIPFLVMLSVTESTRSYRHGMAELEQTARFSLRSIVMARMVMLGLVNLVVLLGAVLLLGNQGQMNGICVFTSFFLTAAGSLCIVRKMRGNEGTFLCFGLAALVSGGSLYIPWQFRELCTPEYAWLWILSCGLGLFVTVRESYQTVRMTLQCEG